MNDWPVSTRRSAALERARDHAPFLRSAMDAEPGIVAAFAEQGAKTAIARALTMAADEAVERRLRVQRRALALAVALGDLAGELTLEQLTAGLSDFADEAIETALGAAIAERTPGEAPRGFAVLALGKLGSRELNYSSDVDLVLLFDPATLPRRERDDAGDAAVRAARRMVDLLQQRTGDGYVARVDLRLRPSPEVTPIALPVDAAISYYESQALPWERAAFIRARAVAGDRVLGERFLAEIQPFIWRRALDFGAIEEIRDISSRIRDHYAQGQELGPGFDLKRGRGGIREVEFYTQVQQLIHGGRDSSLRPGAILDALPALVAAGRMAADEASGLAAAYRRLRTVEHRAQMIDDQQTHRLPTSPAALDNLAALDGLADGTTLVATLRDHVAFVSDRFDALAPDRGPRLSSDPDVLAGELAALGFADVPAVQRLIVGWRSGQVRALRTPAARAAFEAMLPVLLEAVATGPDPANALNRFGDIVERLSSGINLFRLLEAKPRVAESLSLILSHAPALASQLGRRPTLLDGLIDESSFAAPSDAATVAAALAAPPREAFDATLDRVRRQVGERRFALGLQLVARHRDPLDLAVGYAAVAEGAIVALADATRRLFGEAHGRIARGELMILALGRLGGEALTHASDLDLIFLFDAPEGATSDGPKPLSATDYFNRLARRVVAALSAPTASGPLYEVDTRLRPQGEQGMLAVRLDAFAAYQSNEAWTWEHMALCRARPVYGTPAGRAKLAAIVAEVLASSREPATVRADATSMRADVARHKPPSGPLDIKLGPGGLVDLEFAVHVLQLIHRAGFDPRLEVAIADLAAAGLMDAEADADLRLLTRILVTSRLVTPGGGEPEPESRSLVAAVCGHEGWESLMVAHDAARTRIAARWEKVKEGR